MESDDTNDTPPQLDFYCRDCDKVFKAAPDGTGYEQTPCPVCREMCLTVQFEQEEAQRNESETWFASLLGGFLGGRLFRNLTRKPRSRISPPLTKLVQPVTIARYETRADAEADARLLQERDIHAQVVGEETGTVTSRAPDQLPPIELRVPEQAAFTATRLLHAMDPPAEEPAPEPATPEADVTFPCEECGAPLHFPADRRGNVEVCPHCGAYVDVPT